MPPSHLDRLKEYLYRLPGLDGAWIAWHLLRGGKRLDYALLRLRPPPNLFQPYPDTVADRYPAAFEYVRATVGDGADRHLLSFGCSTGEEVFTLRDYFPAARITGIDVRPDLIAACRRRPADPRIAFKVAGTADAESPAGYDAIFAMAVFRHGDLHLDPPPARCDRLIRFADFDRTISGLTRCLKPGGLLVIQHAQFRVADTLAGGDFARLLALAAVRGDPVYGPDDRLVGTGRGDGGVYRAP